MTLFLSPRDCNCRDAIDYRDFIEIELTRLERLLSLAVGNRIERSTEGGSVGGYGLTCVIRVDFRRLSYVNRGDYRRTISSIR